MNVKRNHPAHDPELAQAIRHFRNAVGLTQAQLAVAVGIAPTSIYRYEAGTTAPDLRTLQRLYLFADHKGDQAASSIFLAAARDKAGVGDAEIESSLQALGKGSGAVRLQDVAIQGKKLVPREQLLVTAFILMFRNNTEESSERMMRLLLEPWMKEAKAEFDRSD